jgi:hypothetical protein
MEGLSITYTVTTCSSMTAPGLDVSDLNWNCFERNPKVHDTLAMWRHLEPDRLHAVAHGMPLDESETKHLAHCEFCQELLVFFQEQIAESALGDKAA